MKRLATLAVATGLVLGTATSVNAQNILRGEAGAASGSTAVIMQLLSKYADADSNITVKVNTGQTLTRSLLKLAAAKIEVAVTPVGAFAAMTKGRGPYKKLGDKAKAASKNVRSLFAFLGGHFHPITYADSGIEKFADIKGRTVFVGPPSGSASRQSIGIIGAVTGYKPGKDYKAVKLGWGAANQAFEDGKFDMFMRPQMIGSAMIEQFGASKKIRVLNIPEAIRKSAAWQEYEKTPGRTLDLLPAGTYSNVVNNDKDINAAAYVMMVTVNKKMDDGIAYKLTGAVFDNIEAVHSVSPALHPLTIETAFRNNVVAVHPGAAKFYAEKGIEVPAKLRAK